MDTSPAAVGPQPEFGSDAFFAGIGRAFLAMCATIPLLYLIELVDFATGHWLQHHGGVAPRRFDGMDGILFAPLLHDDFRHVAANSVPLVVLGTFAMAGQVRRFLLLTALLVVVTGIGLWLFERSNSVVVGASGLVFGYLGYLLARGIVERSRWHIAVAVLVGLMYGWLVVGVLPGDARVSWLGHLFGFLAGVGVAVLFRLRAGAPRPEGPTEPGSDGSRDPSTEG